MDLSGMIQNNAEMQGTGQRMSKEEYAAMKKQEREDTWMQIDAQAQVVFRDGVSLQKFLDFMAGQLKKSLALEIERFKVSQKKGFCFMF